MDSLCLTGGIRGIAVSGAAALDVRSSQLSTATVGRPVASMSVEKPSLRRNTWWSFSFRFPLRSFWSRRSDAVAVDDAVLIDEKEEDKVDNGSWIMKILHKQEDDVEKVEEIEVKDSGNSGCCGGVEGCDVCSVNDDGRFDRNSFSKLLKKVSLAEARLYAHMSYLGSLAYSIPLINPESLKRNHGLRFVTSSLDKKQQAAEKDKAAAADQENDVNIDAMNKDVASFMATVVAAKEEVKQAVADDLSSNHSSPCDWFVCDDDQTLTRLFIIQGSESLASWQANLLFEPVQFEGLDHVMVHRGIYEAAKGMYQQMLPELRSHLKTHGTRAKFRFTGHSLGGSLSLLVNLMLLIRGEVPLSSLLPVITFGSPSIMCGGDRLLADLGLPRSHLQAITMHRDIVPRAFSCNYPDHVAEFLKAVNGNFRNHPCLNHQKLLFAPMGEFLILQPDDKFSPNHDLLPSGSGLYLMTDTEEVARNVFLNSPHPLEILSDRSAYGSGGTIQRDHDMNSYLKSIRSVIRREVNSIRKAQRKQRRKVRRHVSSGRFNFSVILQSGKESLKRLSMLVASQHMHLLVLLLFPARLLMIGTLSTFNFL